jgi:demethylmenaquinone methyltransferase/2-methoxy-6-polyprenyl-1,4-benzoquinol methylase
MAQQNPESRWFGEKSVTPEQKTGLVIDVFDSVADSYDVMNDLMSMGVHRLWKDQFVRQIRPRPEYKYLDVAGGTGDIAFRIRKITGGADITVCDLNAEMLRVGRDRATDRGWLNDFEWVVGNAESMPIEDESVDVYTIAFGLRNVTHIDKALADAHRVLKPGGRFFCLEFSHVEEPFLAKMYNAYSYRVIPKIGQMVAKDRESYQYLVESIRKFPNQNALQRRLYDAGFGKVRVKNLSFGIAAIHEAWKF